MKPKTPKKTIGETVREIRGTRTQAEFAELLGISQAFLSEIEHDKKEPGKKIILKLAEISGLPVETFFR